MTVGPYPKRESVMLAHPVTGPKLAKLGMHFLAQPKLNGERARTEWFQDKPFIISSYGNEMNCIPHINAAILKASNFYGVQVKWDGEIYVHGMPRETIHSMCSRRKNPHPDAELLQYHIFDHQDDTGIPQYQRLLNVREFCADQFCPTIQDVQVLGCNPDVWIETLGHYTERNYEGIILRNINGHYEEKRSGNLLKYKPCEKDDYRILDLQEALDIHTKEPKGMVGSFIVCGDDLTPFKVGAGKLSHAKRTALWLERSTIKTCIGKQLLVKHEKIRTINKVPVSCVAVEVMK